MKDSSPEVWEAMAELNNAFTKLIDETHLSPVEVIVVFGMLSDRIKKFLDIKKVE